MSIILAHWQTVSRILELSEGPGTCVCACACVFMCVQVTCTSMWRPEVNREGSSSGAIHLVFEMIPHDTWDSPLCWPVRPRNPPVSTFSVLGLQACHCAQLVRWELVLVHIWQVLCQTRLSLQSQPDTLSTHWLSMFMMDEN